MDEREMFNEINALIGSIAKALSISEAEVITAIEDGRLGMEMQADAEGRNFIEATCDGTTARIYPGAIYRPGDQPEAKIKPESEDCDGGGCSCGH